MEHKVGDKFYTSRSLCKGFEIAYVGVSMSGVFHQFANCCCWVDVGSVADSKPAWNGRFVCVQVQRNLQNSGRMARP